MIEDSISLLIVNFNRCEYLKGTIDSIRDNTQWPYEIIIWDNCSTEPDVEPYLQQLEKCSDVTVFRSPTNIGVWKASNNLIAKAKNRETVGFVKLDNDCIVKTKGWLTKWIECCYINPEVGMIGANIEGKKERSKDTDPIDLRGHQLLSLTDEGTGGMVYVPGRTFAALGMYNEEYGIYGHSDKDYAKRVMYSGQKFCYHQDVEVDRFAVNVFDKTGGYRQHKNDYVRRNRRLYILNRHLYANKLRPLSVWYEKHKEAVPSQVLSNPLFSWTDTSSKVRWDTGKVSQSVRDQIEKHKLQKVKR